MARITRLTSEQRSELIAYLDGELDDAASRDIERTLSENPVARHEIEMLTRTYEMLDVLPQPEGSQEFTDRTLAIVKHGQTTVPLAERAWFQKASRGLLLAGFSAVLVAFGFVGFLAARVWMPDNSDLLVQDLPVIENLEVYREIKDVQFLDDLRQHRYLEENIDMSEEQPGLPAGEADPE